MFVLCTQIAHFKPYHSFQDHMTGFLYCIPNWRLSRPFDQILLLCTQLTAFKTTWPNLINVYLINSFQDNMNWFLHCIPNLLNRLLSRPFDQIFAFCSKLTPFKTILVDFCIVYPIDSFQDHLIWFLHCVHKLLLSIPYNLILSLCTQLTPFKTIWPNFVIVCTIWLLSRPFDLMFVLCTQITHFRPYDSFQDHRTWFLYCVPNWLLSRPFDLMLSLWTQLTAFKTIWPNFIIVYPIVSFQDHVTWFLHCVPKWLLSNHMMYFITVYPSDCFQDHMTRFLYCVPSWL